MLTSRFYCTLCVTLAASAAPVMAQGYPTQGYDQQQQYPQQQYQQPQYPQQPAPDMGMQQQQQPPPGYFPTPDEQGAYGYQQQYAPGYPAQQGPGYPPAAAPEQQQPPQVSSVKGAIQVGAGVSLIQFSSLSMSQAAAAPAVLPADPAAAAAAMQAAAQPYMLITKCCITRQPFSIEGGYGLSDNLLLGAIVQLASASESVGASSPPAKSFGLTLAPKIDYQFSPSSRWNPFVGAVASISLDNTTYYGTKDSRTLFGVSARAGIRYFALDQLSIDPAVSLGALFGSGTQTNEVSLAKADYSLSGFQFAISIGLSLWLK